jgi:DNA-binding response OmpR family regulator
MGTLSSAPLRSHGCGKRFYKRVSPAPLRSRTAHGCSLSVHSGVLPITEQRIPAVLVVDDFNPLSSLTCETLAHRGFAVIGAKSPDEGLALFQSHQPEIDMAVIDLMTPGAGYLDLAAELERLRPGLPVLYLVDANKTIARCSIEAQAPGSVLVVPFTEEQLIARVGGLLDSEAAGRQKFGGQGWEGLIAASGSDAVLTTRHY